jgi:hypothetical protein
VASKTWHPTTTVHGAAVQKTSVSVFIAVKTSDLNQIRTVLCLLNCDSQEEDRNETGIETNLCCYRKAVL